MERKMKKKIGFILCTILNIGLLFVFPAPTFSQSAWQASYWNNTTLSGEPAMSRQELEIKHNWGSGSPSRVISSDQFSARWTRTEQLNEGSYRFTATADDGIRIWINGIQVVDAWENTGGRSVSAEVYLQTGLYDIRVEYVDWGGAASVELERTAVDQVVRRGQSNTVAGSGPDLVSDLTAWSGEYYNNRTLTGTPALTKKENNIDFRWGTGSPAAGIIDAESFSARWTRTLDLEPGRYRFSVTADDGIRLYVNNRLLIDEWHSQAATTYSATTELSGGRVEVRIEYYENGGKATARFSYAKIITESIHLPLLLAGDEQSGSWRGEYFDNVNLSGPPSFVRTDEKIDFDWGAGSPAFGQLGVDRFSIRWTDTLRLSPGRYRFSVTADDGVRLIINGTTLIDEFTVQSATRYAADVDVSNTPVNVTMEYFENTGSAIARLTWRRLNSATSSSSELSLPVDEPVAAVANTAGLNVRSGPGVDFTQITVLSRNQVVEMIGRNRMSSWIQISLTDGRSGWVNRRYLRSNYEYSKLRETG